MEQIFWPLVYLPVKLFIPHHVALFDFIMAPSVLENIFLAVESIFAHPAHVLKGSACFTYSPRSQGLKQTSRWCRDGQIQPYKGYNINPKSKR